MHVHTCLRTTFVLESANLPVSSSKKSHPAFQGHIINRASTGLFLILKLTPNSGNQDKKKKNTAVVEQIIIIFNNDLRTEIPKREVERDRETTA